MLTKSKKKKIRGITSISTCPSKQLFVQLCTVSYYAAQHFVRNYNPCKMRLPLYIFFSPTQWINVYGETLTLQAFLFEKKVNHDPPVLSIPLVPLVPSLADCELSAQITGAKKQESLGSLSRHNSRPFFVCSHCNTAAHKCSHNEEHMRGLMRLFTY